MSGERLTFLATSRDTGGAYARVLFTLPPRGAGTPRHLHTTFSERFEVVSGRLNVAFEGDEPPIVLSPGESVSVPPYTVHRFCNGTDEETVFEAEVRPPGGFEVFMRASFGLVRDGRTSRGVPHNPLELGLLMQPADVFLPGLPVPVQKAVFGVLASAARHLGYETRFLQYADPDAREDGTGGAADAADRGTLEKACGVASRKADERARGLAAVVGGVSLGIGLALAFAPRSSAASLGWADRAFGPHGRRGRPDHRTGAPARPWPRTMDAGTGPAERGPLRRLRVDPGDRYTPPGSGVGRAPGNVCPHLYRLSSGTAAPERRAQGSGAWGIGGRSVPKGLGSVGMEPRRGSNCLDGRAASYSPATIFMTSS